MSRLGHVLLVLSVAGCTANTDIPKPGLELEVDEPAITQAHGRSSGFEPDAVDDTIMAYEVQGAATLTIPGQEGVLTNDVLRAGTLVTGATLSTAAGGTIVLANDGSFQYTAPSSLPSTGIDSFAYTVQNENGSDTATVTLVVACGSETCSGCCTDTRTCMEGNTDDACGSKGDACESCTNSGDTCDAGMCVNTAIAADGFVDDSRVHLLDLSSAKQRRRNLVRYIWGGDGYPFTLLPSQIEYGVASPIPGITFAARVDRLPIALPDGFSTAAYVYRPLIENLGVVIWHQGHTDDLGEGGGAVVVERLLANHFTVIVMWMPVYGESAGPVASHEALMTRSMPSGTPMRIFLEPAVAVINWVFASGEFSDDVSMMGLSGGGWTTTIMAAIDPRIRRSIPVAGSLPLYARDNPSDRGDIEQSFPAMYRILGYLDLYVLATLDGERKQLQVLNRYDNCCYSGVRSREFEPIVRSAVEALTDIGSYRVFLDESHNQHQVSPTALSQQIIPFLTSN